tara:strand:+ start:77520 stop:78098 length:579 start_codon:yes stop_codon:yes gene_type:complete
MIPKEGAVVADVTLSAQNALPQGDVIERAGTAIRVLPMQQMTSMMPGAGADALATVLMDEHGLALPGVGQTSTSAGGRCLWFGHRQYLLIGVSPAHSLSDVAALTDQSDGWSTVLLEGPLARDVLARLCPLDLRAAHFAQGAVARTEIRHMMACVTRVSEDGFRLMVFRSMAETLLDELRHGLLSCAARENL